MAASNNNQSSNQQLIQLLQSHQAVIQQLLTHLGNPHSPATTISSPTTPTQPFDTIQDALERDVIPEQETSDGLQPSNLADTISQFARRASVAFTHPIHRRKSKAVTPISVVVQNFQIAKYDELGQRVHAPPSTSPSAPAPAIKFAIHPLSTFKVHWDFYYSLFYLFLAVLIPLLTSFEDLYYTTQFTPISIFLTITYSFDTIIQLLTLTESDVHSRIHVFTLQNLINIISTIPFELILNEPFYLWLRLLRLYNFLAFASSNAIWKGISKRFQEKSGMGVAFVTMTFLSMLLVLFLHINSCLTFLFGWVQGYTHDRLFIDNPQIIKEDLFSRYTFGFIVSVSNMFPIGYRPAGVYAQVVSVITNIFGAYLYAAIVGTISTFSFGLNSSARLFKQKMDEVNEYLQSKNIHDDLKQRIRDYYSLKYRGKYFDELAILSELNDSLRKELTAFNCRQLIEKVPFLKRQVGDGRDESFIGRIATSLRPNWFLKNDVVFEQGEWGDVMYFILYGSVEIVVNQRVVGALHEGNFFGEVAVMAKSSRMATVRVTTNSVLYSLSRADFETILYDFPDVSKNVQSIFQERMKKMGLQKK